MALELVSSILLTFSKLMGVPSEYQLPLAVLAVLVVCLVVYAAGITVQNVGGKDASMSKFRTITGPQTPGSPPPRRPETPMGTVTTPAGRRSARLARRRKEE